MSMVEYVVGGIRKELMAGTLRPGERVTTAALAQRLGVSHIPIREALRILEAEGQVIWDSRRGIRVRPISAAEVRDIYFSRGLLETEALTLGIPLLDPTDDRQLVSLAEAMGDATGSGDLARYHDLARPFHFVPFERCGRPWLIRLINILWDAASRYQMPLFVDGAWRREHLHRHEAILEALLQRDVHRVSELMSLHRAWLIEHAVLLEADAEERQTGGTRGRAKTGAAAVRDAPR